MMNAVWDVGMFGFIDPSSLAFIGLFLTTVVVVGFNFSEVKLVSIASWASLVSGASCFLAFFFLW